MKAFRVSALARPARPGSDGAELWRALGVSACFTGAKSDPPLKLNFAAKRIKGKELLIVASNAPAHLALGAYPAAGKPGFGCWGRCGRLVMPELASSAGAFLLAQSASRKEKISF